MLINLWGKAEQFSWAKFCKCSNSKFVICGNVFTGMSFRLQKSFVCICIILSLIVCHVCAIIASIARQDEKPMLTKTFLRYLCTTQFDRISFQWQGTSLIDMVTMQSAFDEITKKILLVFLSLLNVRIWLRLVLMLKRLFRFLKFRIFSLSLLT